MYFITIVVRRLSNNNTRGREGKKNQEKKSKSSKSAGILVMQQCSRVAVDSRLEALLRLPLLY